MWPSEVVIFLFHKTNGESSFVIFIRRNSRAHLSSLSPLQPHWADASLSLLGAVVRLFVLWEGPEEALEECLTCLLISLQSMVCVPESGLKYTPESFVEDDYLPHSGQKVETRRGQELNNQCDMFSYGSPNGQLPSSSLCLPLSTTSQQCHGATSPSRNDTCLGYVDPLDQNLWCFPTLHRRKPVLSRLINLKLYSVIPVCDTPH